MSASDTSGHDFGCQAEPSRTASLNGAAWLRRFLPARTAVNGAERLRVCCGALLGVGLTALLSHAALGPGAAALCLIAPMGASAVLLFAVPASPLAQPWSVLGGNVVSALIGVACAQLIAPPLPSAACAGALAICAMFALRCLHPPSGAVALTAVLGGPAIHALGYGYALIPVGLNTALLLGVALVFNNLTGRRYPHGQHAPRQAHQTGDPAPTARLGFSPADLDQVLRNYNQVLDISRADLEAILLQTEMGAHQRRFGAIRCVDIMSKDIVSVDFGTDLDEAWQLLLRHRINALPVLNRARRVIGIVTRSDFLRHAQVLDLRNSRNQLRRFLTRSLESPSDKAEVVGQIMSGAVTLARTDQAVVELVALMSDRGMHQIPVVDDEQRLAGMISQPDMIAALFEAGVHHA